MNSMQCCHRYSNNDGMVESQERKKINMMKCTVATVALQT